MTFKAFPETKAIINSLPEFKLDMYTNAAASELVVFAVYAVQKDGLYAATEEIVSTCFKLFPHRFSLKNYFYWPDSALVMSSLNEAKVQGDLKGNPTDGFAVKVQGRQTVKQVAKILGITLPAPQKKMKKPAPTQEKKVMPVKAKAGKKAVVKPAEPAVKKNTTRQKIAAPKKKINVPSIGKKHTKKIVPKQAATVKMAAKSITVKQTLLPKLKVETKKKEGAKPVASSPIRKAPALKKDKPKKQVSVKSAHPAQLTMSLLPAVKKVEPKPVKKETVTAPVVAAKVSKEEKVKAGKFVRVMETSDAYRQYKKNGEKSKISEFDFRSLLLCTMESSPETLARNVNTFKGYANTQNRQDLVTFLNFVENSFSTLLNSSGKKLVKKNK
ncbi:MAG: hypothetical protein JNM02_11065 [Anaerolineales bacterium]|nr:hypothetical protein [Anaerolineales bacterium]